MSEVCKDCLLYKKHKENCYFYWEGKRKCTQFIHHETGVSQFRNEDEEFEKLINQ